MVDELSAPLGRPARRKPFRLPAWTAGAVAAALGMCLTVFVMWAMVAVDPLGGEPVVVLAVPERVAPATGGDRTPDAEPDPKGKSDAGPDAKAAAAVPTPGTQTVTIIDGSSGTRQEVVVPASEGAPVETRLLEKTRHGHVPRVALDGARPLALYARPVAVTPEKAALPRIALVVGGLGLSAGTTAEALGKLPAPVTFAFAPYGSDLDRLTARARGEGHEILLQVPMEPFDYPDNDPGPQTLLSTLAPEQNVDRMHWAMSRFKGYVGVAGYMGTRFTAADATLAPVLREVAKRGLMYFDDASSPRSIAGQIAGANNLPFVKANVVLDAVPTAAEIDRALLRLESMARDNGVAVGTASALPVSIERLARWAKSAESRGFLLVPISQAAPAAKSKS